MWLISVRASGSTVSAYQAEGRKVHTIVVGSVGNGVGTGAREATIVVSRTGPITADGGVDDN